jgi:hypothetical protein
VDDYNRVQDEIRAIDGSAYCAKCRKPLGATKVRNSDGKLYYSEYCARW